MTRSLISIFILILISASADSQELNSFGYTIEDDEHLEFIESVEFSRSASLPISYSLEEYMPEIGDQGAYGTCTVWATVYHAFTVLKRSEDSSFKEVFNPYSVWNPMKSRFYGEEACQNQGGLIVNVLSYLNENGAETYKSYESNECRFEQEEILSYEKLHDFKKISPNKIEQIKYLISSGQPVVFGMKVYQTNQGESNSFGKKYINSDGLFDFPEFKTLKQKEGHAVCVIGYDDIKFGGAFKIANSWGSSWGDKGYFWLKYDDVWAINTAYALLNEKSMSEQANQNGVNSSSIIVKNYTNEKMHLALAYQVGEEIISQGWMTFYPSFNRKIELKNRNSSELYYLLMDEDGNLVSNNGVQGEYKEMGCVLDSAFYCTYSNCNSNTKYKKVNQVFEGNVFALGVVQNDKIGDFGKCILGEYNHSDIHASNIHWNGTYLLIDPINHQIISDVADDTQKTTFFYIYKNKVKSKAIKNKKLFKMKVEKFSTFETATEFLESNP